MTILTKIEGYAGIIILNRPHKYNAIDLITIRQITQFLNESLQNDKIKKIILTSNHSKAFCSGGDIYAAYQALKINDFAHGNEFFKEEYRLIYSLATYPKPIISLVNGVCFGGGMGISMHNQHRIITENAILGMPETIIGFFPDVGASYRFSKFPKEWASFYALTGYNIALYHALKWNMADYFVLSTTLPELLNSLCSENGNDQQIIENFVSTVLDLPIFGQSWVEKVFETQDFFQPLRDSSNNESKKTLHDLQLRSPLSLRVTAKLLEIGQFLDLKKSLILDRILASNFMRNPDFQEGIRAQVIDKDRKPNWYYSAADIDDETLRDFFVPTYTDCEYLNSDPECP